MCGIAGIIYRNGDGAHRVGRDMTRMLQSMKHRGPDSTGYALYRAPTHELTLRLKHGAAISAEDFPAAFLVVGAMTAASAFIFARLPPDAGAELAGREARLATTAVKEPS